MGLSVDCKFYMHLFKKLHKLVRRELEERDRETLEIVAMSLQKSGHKSPSLVLTVH